MSHYIELNRERTQRPQFIVKPHRGKINASYVELRFPFDSCNVPPSKEHFVQTFNHLKGLGQESPSTLFFLIEEHSLDSVSQQVLIYTRTGHRENGDEYVQSVSYKVAEGYCARRLVTYGEELVSVDIHRIGVRRKKTSVFFVLKGSVIWTYDNGSLPPSVKVPGAETFLEAASTWMNIATPDQLEQLEKRLLLRRLELEANEAFQSAEKSELPTVKLYSETLERLLDKEDVPLAMVRQTIDMIKALC